MAKRKFSGKKLYRLLKTLVIIFSVIFLLLGIFNLVNFYSKGEEFLDKQLTLCNEAFGGKDEYYVKLHAVCSSDVFAYHGYWESRGWKFTGAGIGLLAVFFGGTWLYKYLFPEIKEKK